MKCEKCDKDMRQIGPFAQTKAEGEPAGKWDGVLDFQCVNPDCENYNKIIRKETLG